MDLLENEALKGENQSNLYTFVTLFIIIALAAAICCYLNYQFPSSLAQNVFYMFIGAFIGDLILSRILMILTMALVHYNEGKLKGYRKINYK